MLTVKILFTINSLEKKKKLFIQDTIYNSCRFKTTSFSLERVNLTKKNLFELKTFHFNNNSNNNNNNKAI